MALSLARTETPAFRDLPRIMSWSVSVLALKLLFRAHLTDRAGTSCHRCGPSRGRQRRFLESGTSTLVTRRKGWAGLTPVRSQSGERDESGESTRTRNTALHTVFCQASTVMLNGTRQMNWPSPGRSASDCEAGQEARHDSADPAHDRGFLRTWLDSTKFRFSRDQVPSPDPA